MQLPVDQLEAHLRRGVRALYVLHGDEPLLWQEAGDAIRQAGRAAGYTERTVFTVTGAHFDWSSVLAAGQEMSLFADRQLIELRIPSGKPGREGGQALERLAATAATQTDVLTLIGLPRLDAATQRSAWFKALEAQAVVLRIDTLERKALPAWMAQRLQRQGQHVPAGDAGRQLLEHLADRVEGHLLAAHQEILKLGLLYPPGELSVEQVESAVLDVSRHDPFQVGAAMLDGEPWRVQRMLDGLQAEGVAAVPVHWSLAEDIRALHAIRLARDEGRALPAVMREWRVWGEREKRFTRLLPRLSREQLARWLREAHVVDGIIKGLPAPAWPSDPWQALHRWAVGISQACMPPARRPARH